MKRLFFISGCVIGAIGFLLIPDISFAGEWSVNIVSPKGGEQWEAGKTYNIEWDCKGLIEVGIALEKGGQQVLEISGPIPANCQNGEPHRFSWTIPGNTPKGADYKIKVYDEDTISCYGAFDCNFNVSEESISGYFTIFNESNPGTGTCYAPTGEITASKTLVQPGEEFTISVKGYDDNRVSRVCHNNACLPCDDKEKNQCSKSWKYALPNPNTYYFSGKVEDSDLSLDYCSKNNTVATEPPTITVTVASMGSCAALCAPQKAFVASYGCELFPAYGITGICSFDCVNKGRTIDSNEKNCLCLTEASMDEASCLAKKSSKTTPATPTTPGGSSQSGGARGSSASQPGVIQNPLAYDTVEGLINHIIDFLIKIGSPIAAIMFVIAGIMFVTSAGDAGRLKTAKNIMLYTAIGFAVILVASGLIKVLQSLLGGS